MIENEILDSILPVPELDELREKTIGELQQAGFVITNFHPGGVWYTLLMIVLRIRIELIQLLRSVLNNSFAAHAMGTWLDLKGGDYGKRRKAAQKAQGFITLSRAAADETITIPKGQVFKTERDINGEELRYIAQQDTVLAKGALTAPVIVEAEKAGARYNVPPGQITRTLTYINGIESIKNAEGWITREGSDVEDDESFRARLLRSWADLAMAPIHDTYVNTCEAIPGVLYAKVNDHHPRGQGTVDVIITSTAGSATENLLADARAALEAIKLPDEDLLVKSSEVVTQPITLTVTVPADANDDGVQARVRQAIKDLLQINKKRTLNELLLADLIYQVKSSVSTIKNVKITTPAADVLLADDKVILPGEITITVEGV